MTKKPTRSRKATNPRRYISASVRRLDGFGTLGSKPRPFNYEIALRQFNHWSYALAMKNANGVASVPLRLFTYRPPTVKASYEFASYAEWKMAAAETKAMVYATRPVSEGVKRYLTGRASIRPSNKVTQKAVAYGSDIEEIVEPHPVLTVLRTANPIQNGHELTVKRMIDLQATGCAYIHPIIDPLRGVPVQYWRMASQWTKVRPVPEPESANIPIAGYVYGAGTEMEKTFAFDEVIQFQMPNPSSDFYGKGWFEAGWTALGLHQAKRELDTAFADNYQRPDSLLSLKGVAPDGLKRILGSIKEQVEGTTKAGRMIAVNAEATLTPLNWEVTETGTPQKIIEELCAISGVPIAMVLTNDPTKASSVTARLGWYRETIHPYCINDEEKLNERWVPLFAGSEDYFVCYDPVSFEDEAELAKRALALVGGPLITGNEGRSIIGYGPIEGGDVRNPPAGNTGPIAAATGNLPPEQNDERNNESELRPL